MRTLAEILNSEAKTEIESAIKDAYYAGQSQMRGRITMQIKERLDTLPKSRYCHLVRRTANHFCLGIDGINANYLEGRGDSGEGEAAELLSFGYDI